MRRLHLNEIHEQSWCPPTLRDAATDFLGFLANTLDYFEAVAPMLSTALDRAGARRIVDLASGGGGPWPGLLCPATEHDDAVRLVLTDLHPNADAMSRLSDGSDGRISFDPAPVDAMSVPTRLSGARTLFGSLHHFRPAQVTAIVRDAVARNELIAAFEPQERRVASILSICLLPIAAWLAAPFIQPFRWSRVGWTYPLPFAPLVIWLDGLVSCLRTYSPEELREIVDRIDAPGYRWEIGRRRMRRMPLRITYLIGIPPRRSVPRP